MSKTNHIIGQKNDILKSWREECMMMFSSVEQHHMVLFNDRWVQRLIKEKDNIEKMKERLIARSVSLGGSIQPINVQIHVPKDPTVSPKRQLAKTGTETDHE